ncbi:MAG: hypothetical protein WA001_05210 [Patescibacteria group bacterium]
MDLFTGAYGIVALPDSITERKVRDLGRRPIGTSPDPQIKNNEITRHAEFSTTTAHITLYHGKLREIPRTEVEMILRTLKPLCGSPILFDKIAVYGGKFLFLDVEVTPELRLAHLAALHLAHSLDRSSAAKATEEGLKMSDDERASLERFGQPLTYALARPHFTLAYNSGGFPNYRTLGPFDGTGRIDRFAFAEIGEYGSVKNIILEV